MNEIPECFCEDPPECTWSLTITGTLQNDADPDKMSREVVLKVGKIPQVVGQILLTKGAEAINKVNAEVYLGFLEGCHTEDSAVVKFAKQELGE